MTKAIIGDIWACVDCVMSRENDETEGISEERAGELWSQLGGYDVTPNWSSDDSGDVTEGYYDFTYMPCDACGDHLAGTRYRYALWN